MPRQPDWFQRVPSAIAVLRASSLPLLDRRSIEVLLDVHRRQAIRILHRFGAVQSGSSLSIPRDHLLASLEQLLDNPHYQHQRRRTKALHESLDITRQSWAARHIPIISPSPTCFIDGLDPAITLHPGLLEIRFQSSHQLLSHLFSVASNLAKNPDLLESIDQSVNFTPPRITFDL